MSACCRRFKDMENLLVFIADSSVPLAFPQSLLYKQLAETGLCRWMCSSEALMTFNLSVWIWSEDSPHLISPSGKRSLPFCLSSPYPSSPLRPLQTVHRHYNKTCVGTGDLGVLWAQPREAEGSLFPLSCLHHQFAYFHRQPPQEQWPTEKDGLFHGKDSRCHSNAPGLVSLTVALLLAGVARQAPAARSCPDGPCVGSPDCPQLPFVKEQLALAALKKEPPPGE